MLEFWPSALTSWIFAMPVICTEWVTCISACSIRSDRGYVSQGSAGCAGVRLSTLFWRHFFTTSSEQGSPSLFYLCCALTISCLSPGRKRQNYGCNVIMTCSVWCTFIHWPCLCVLFLKGVLHCSSLQSYAMWSDLEGGWGYMLFGALCGSHLFR